MQNQVSMIARFVAKKISKAETDKLVEIVVQELSVLEGLMGMVLFGSAANYTMDEASDIDVVMIFESIARAKEASKIVHTLRRQATWPMDILCIDVNTFNKKSRVGGVYYIVRREGRTVFGKMP